MILWAASIEATLEGNTNGARLISGCFFLAVLMNITIDELTVARLICAV